MTCMIKTVYGTMRTDEAVIWFWISCWEHDPMELPLAA
jgi:hypothetical protein